MSGATRALFGDTNTPIYGCDEDPDYANSSYKGLEDGYDGYAKTYPEYVPKPRKLFEKNSTIRVYSTYDNYLGPNIWIKPANSWAWIDASRNRGKIKAAIAVLFGLVLFAACMLVIDRFLKKNLQVSK